MLLPAVLPACLCCYIQACCGRIGRLSRPLPPSLPPSLTDHLLPSHTHTHRLRGGDLDGIDRTKLPELYPEVHEARLKDKLNYRYPGAGGESYADVIQRIRPIIVELERQRRSVLVVCHLAVQRCLYGYFMGCGAMSEIPYISLPKHAVIELTPGPFGCTESVVPLFERQELVE